MIDQVPGALLPIVLLIALGAALRRGPLLDAGFWPQAERLSYFVLLPVLFFHGLATARLEALPILPMAAALAGSVLIAAGGLTLARPWLGVDGPAFTSVLQGGIRFNNFVGITLAAGLFGTPGVALAAVCNAVLVPLVNVLSVAALARHGTARLTGRQALRQIALNPLLLACVLGAGFRAAGLDLPRPLAATLGTLGAAALPLGLLCVGAGLRFAGMGGWVGPIAVTAAARFVAMPVLCLALGLAAGLDGMALTVAVMFQALPTATSAYILARQLGGDAPLMAAIIAAQTLLALATLPLTLWALTLL